MINDRKINIIQYLYENENLFVTSGELAKVIECSVRTIKRDLKGLIDEQDDRGYRITSSNKGYAMHITDKDIFNSIFNMAKSRSRTLNNIDSFDKGRTIIIGQLLVINDYIKINDLSEILYLSRSIIINEIREIKKVFQTCNLTLESKPYYGYFVLGEEKDKRNFLVSYLDILLKNEKYFVVNGKLIEYKYEEVKAKTIKIILENNIIKSDKHIELISRYMYIAIMRMQNEYFIEFDDKKYNKITVDIKTIKASRKLINSLIKEADIKIPMEEHIYLSHLIGNSYMGKSLSLIKTEIGPSSEQIYKLVENCLFKIKNIMKLDFTDDVQLINGLVNHLNSSLGIYSSKTSLDNPILEMLKTNYIESYNCALICDEIIKKELALNLKEDGIGYVALHFAASIERKKDYKVKICIICENGIGFSQFIKSKLEEQMADIKIINTIPKYMLRSIDLKIYDLLITTVDLNNIKLGIPAIKINHNLNHGEIRRIKREIENVNLLKNFFSKIPKNFFYLKANFTSKKSLLNEILSNMVREGYISQNEVEDIINRENLSETVINDSVALPHCIKNGESTGAIVTLKSPIMWGDKRISIVILACINPQIGIEKQLYPMISKKTKNKSTVNKLLNAGNVEEFIRILIK